MESITLYHEGRPVIHHPLPGDTCSVGSDPGDDIVLAGEGAGERRLLLYRGEDGRWLSRPDPSLAEERARPVEPGKRLALGPYALEIGSLRAAAPEDLDGEPGPDAGGAISDDLGLVGRSAAMRLLRMDVRRFGALGAPVLIQGETGTGKELVARAIHDCSPRRRGPLVTINCGALSESLVQDALFGHERGAFTGAGSIHRGVFEQADGGTLFLDEIGELPPAQQAALLRVLDDGRVRRLGAERDAKVDVRVAAATNCDLREMVRRGDFRADLYHRLAALRISTPPLRDRPEDIGPLAEHFLTRMEKEVGVRRLSAAALRLLESCKWPGNARELRNVLYRAAAFSSRARIPENALILDEQRPIARARRKRSAAHLRKLSTKHLEEIIERHRGNVASAARELGVPRTTLRDRIKGTELL
ncbi:MAG: sigma 54-dependent Fis family transcriptional regulator [Polyangia bacterium]